MGLKSTRSFAVLTAPIAKSIKILICVEAIIIATLKALRKTCWSPYPGWLAFAVVIETSTAPRAVLVTVALPGSETVNMKDMLARNTNALLSRRDCPSLASCALKGERMSNEESVSELPHGQLARKTERESRTIQVHFGFRPRHSNTKGGMSTSGEIKGPHQHSIAAPRLGLGPAI